MIVAEHELGAPGTASIRDAHYDGPRRHPTADHDPKTIILRQQFCALGKMRKRSWSGPPPSATPGWVPSWRSCSGWAPPTVNMH